MTIEARRVGRFVRRTRMTIAASPHQRRDDDQRRADHPPRAVPERDVSYVRTIPTASSAAARS